MVLRSVKSMYGLKQVFKTFFDNLSGELVERCFTASTHDQYLFMKQDMICIVYVDDSIIAGLDSIKIDELIKDLGVSNEDCIHNSQLKDESEVGDVLRIRIEKTGRI